jgi:hypothetical protein
LLRDARPKRILRTQAARRVKRQTGRRDMELICFALSFSDFLKSWFHAMENFNDNLKRRSVCWVDACRIHTSLNFRQGLPNDLVSVDFCKTAAGRGKGGKLSVDHAALTFASRV